MKKSRILAFSLIVMVMLMGAGYAAWTDTLNINNTVKTGNLDVNFSENPGVVFNTDNAGVAKVVVSETVASGNEATVKLENLYPGATATVTIPVKNDGSIPVKNGTFTFTPDKTWITVTPSSQPTELAVGETKDVVYTITIGEDALEDTTGTVTATATFDQFNK